MIRKRGIRGSALQSVLAVQSIDQRKVIIAEHAFPITGREEVQAVDSIRFPVTIVAEANSGLENCMPPIACE